MSRLNRLFDIAAKALDKSGSSSAPRPTNAGGGTDWRDLVRKAADQLTGDERGQRAPDSAAPGVRQYGAPPQDRRPAAPAVAADRTAIARYDYLLQTAEPQQLEQVHREAFARLTPAQREQVQARLRSQLPPEEQPTTADPDLLARVATRGEARQPGFLKGVFGSTAGKAALGAGAGAAVGAGVGVAAGGLLAAVAGGAVLSSVAGPLLDQAAGLGVDFDQFAGGVEEFTGAAGEFGTAAEEFTGGIGEFGANFETPSFEVPGFTLGDLFDR